MKRLLIAVISIWNALYLALFFLPLALGYQQAEYAEPRQWVAIIEFAFCLGFAGFLLYQLIRKRV